MTKDVFDAVRERISTRSFKPDEIPEFTLTRLVEAACHAPSAGNVQPWKFFIVLNESVKRKLAEAAYNQAFIAEAPAVICTCVDVKMSEKRYGKRGRELYCIQDTAAAVQNILICAAGLGLDTCWIGAFDEESVSDVLELENNLRPVAMVPVGYGNKAGKKPARRSMEEVVEIIK